MSAYAHGDVNIRGWRAHSARSGRSRNQPRRQRSGTCRTSQHKRKESTRACSDFSLCSPRRFTQSIVLNHCSLERQHAERKRRGTHTRKYSEQKYLHGSGAVTPTARESRVLDGPRAKRSTAAQRCPTGIRPSRHGTGTLPPSSPTAERQGDMLRGPSDQSDTSVDRAWKEN